MTISDQTGRPNGRRNNELRPVSIEPGFAPYAEGSALIKFGDTHVLCTATIEKGVPPFLLGTGKGWVTAEYGMLPRSSPQRISRKKSIGGGRTLEIQRLIGRSLRAAIDLNTLGERSIQIDCDVMQADGGTRTAAITGSYVALHQALAGLVVDGELEAMPEIVAIAAVSVGVLDNAARLDLEYIEDANADVDCNVVMNNRGEYVEIQGTAEIQSFPRKQLMDMLDLADVGIGELLELQRAALGVAD